MASNPKTNEPSQITGQINTAIGLAEQAVGAVIHESLGSTSWTESGTALQAAGEKEVEEAKRKKAVEAGVDAGVGKVKSAVGYVTGDQSQQTQGNTQVEKAQWDYKQASSDSPLSVPVPSVEGVKGKLESVQGIVTGDAEKQKEGNVKAEKAAWKDGV
ncbi:hypothetical protein L198_00667 [Cryptococcus wingfieldii CBS 7118]|uniref:CsbD-like domain-containing protein n=1 Tax=Cryptococcus wingfieldii CBS 7118 TaxID=1295528 RepID=A0A1E3K6V5_9TREE|nr:hypothetical protein L198_00667 [Cryptococcus wingfieldii CBS 7118]ODO08928.1 hypothetical protein L198_00667 [Cryptococcus wingfieldii CBS 7118]